MGKAIPCARMTRLKAEPCCRVRSGNVKPNEKFLPGFQRRLAGSRKKIGKRHTPAFFQIRYLGLGFQGHQGNRAICGG